MMFENVYFVDTIENVMILRALETVQSFNLFVETNLRNDVHNKITKY